MFMSKRFWISGTVLLGLISVLLAFSANLWAVETIKPEIQEPGKIELVMGKSFVLPVPESVKKSDNIRVTIAEPEIADFIFIPKVNRRDRVRNIYLKGLKPGMTNMTLWKNGSMFRVYDIAVNFDTSLLKQKIHNILPDEKDIRIFATQDSITLSGPLSSTENLNQVMMLANAFAGEENTVNLLSVGGSQQIMLEVKVAEMQKSVISRLGINFNWINNAGDFGVQLLGALSGFNFAGTGATTGFSPDATGLFRFHSGTSTWTGIIDLLKGNGMIKILAEPTLIALSGQTANFLAGGEFPIPEIDDDGNVGVDFKPYGVELAFTPTVLSDKKISMKVQPVVSELDFAVGTTIAGATVPGTLIRKAATVIELADGQSFAIAGILQETSRENVEKYPGLGDIPVLGALFKSKSYQKQETELVIIVTAHLVKPLNMAEQTLPTDFYIDPDDAEFYLWGVFGRSHENTAFGEAELDGEFGHIFEEEKK
ncbi:MAG: type II and III secretion system protein family protein [Desulfobacterales bacterium]|nr:MAG: type II and III secretion system protein family protein [Desulfobacterales bacterium]